MARREIPADSGAADVRCLPSTCVVPLLMELDSQIANLLSHLTSVLEHMEPAWAHAFLKRTRLSDADFLGDVLAVIST